jgi:alpha-tubulin suppressor-like RCC1 family protein
MLFAWGQGTNGAIGNNAIINRSTPVQIGGTINTLFYSPTQLTTSSYSQVSAGLSHTLAITSTGTLFSWGRNDAGQLGITAGINNISLSLQGIVLQRSDGTVAVAGVGIFGQLLDGTTLATSARSAPVQLGTYYSNNIDTWIKLAVYNQAYSGFIGIKKDGTLWAWGTNANGQLGDNSTITRSSPVQIGSSIWIDISIGTDHVIGIQNNGTLWSWGANANGQVGDNTTISRSSPVQITSISANFVSYY